MGTSILEEMQGWGLRETHWTYGLDGAAASYVVDTRSNAYASKWQSDLDQTLVEAYALIELDCLSPLEIPPPLIDARAMRMTVTVHWAEGERERQIQLSAMKM